MYKVNADAVWAELLDDGEVVSTGPVPHPRRHGRARRAVVRIGDPLGFVACNDRAEYCPLTVTARHRRVDGQRM